MRAMLRPALVVEQGFRRSAIGVLGRFVYQLGAGQRMTFHAPSIIIDCPWWFPGADNIQRNGSLSLRPAPRRHLLVAAIGCMSYSLRQLARRPDRVHCYLRSIRVPSLL